MISRQLSQPIDSFVRPEPSELYPLQQRTHLAVHHSMLAKHNHLARCRHHEGRHHRARLLADHIPSPVQSEAARSVGYAVDAVLAAAGAGGAGAVGLRLAVEAIVAVRCAMRHHNVPIPSKFRPGSCCDSSVKADKGVEANRSSTISSPFVCDGSEYGGRTKISEVPRKKAETLCTKIFYGDTVKV